MRGYQVRCRLGWRLGFAAATMGGVDVHAVRAWDGGAVGYLMMCMICIYCTVQSNERVRGLPGYSWELEYSDVALILVMVVARSPTAVRWGRKRTRCSMYDVRCAMIDLRFHHQVFFRIVCEG